LPGDHVRVDSFGNLIMTFEK
jgi:hypothetical protein